MLRYLPPEWTRRINRETREMQSVYGGGVSSDVVPELFILPGFRVDVSLGV